MKTLKGRIKAMWETPKVGLEREINRSRRKAEKTVQTGIVIIIISVLNYGHYIRLDPELFDWQLSGRLHTCTRCQHNDSSHSQPKLHN